MRVATGLLLTALLAGCAGSPAPATTFDDPPAQAEPAADRRHLDLTGEAGDWVVIIQRFGGVVDSYSLEYRYALSTVAGADVLTMRPASNSEGRYGLVGRQGETLHKSADGTYEAGGTGVGSGPDFDGLAYAFASSAPWTLSWESKPSATVSELVVLRGNGTTFGTAAGQPSTTAASQRAHVDLQMAPETWTVVDLFLGGPPHDMLTSAVVPYATLAADVAGTTCDDDENPTSGELSGFGAWDVPGAITATLDIPVTAVPAELRYATMSLGNATLPDGWALGTYCSSHG